MITFLVAIVENCTENGLEPAAIFSSVPSLIPRVSYTDFFVATCIEKIIFFFTAAKESCMGIKA